MPLHLLAAICFGTLFWYQHQLRLRQANGALQPNLTQRCHMRWATWRFFEAEVATGQHTFSCLLLTGPSSYVVFFLPPKQDKQVKVMDSWIIDLTTLRFMSFYSIS
jgi:hypothetical protein